jgi:hypothetical protein
VPIEAPDHAPALPRPPQSTGQQAHAPKRRHEFSGGPAANPKRGMVSAPEDDARAIDIAAVRAANEALRRDLYAQREVVAQLKSALQVQLAKPQEKVVVVEKKVADQSSVVDNACEIIEPMEQVEERPPTPYTPPLPPVQKEDIPEPFEEEVEVKPVPIKEEKKPIQIFDTKTNSFSAELAVPRGNVNFDQKNQTLYKKKKIPRDQR